MPLETTSSLGKPNKKVKFFKRLVNFFSRIPGSGKDQFFLSIVLLDLIFFLFQNSYGNFFPSNVLLAFLIFDLCVVTIWGFDVLKRFYHYENKWQFFQIYWYEILGVLPFNFFRPFLLLRALKIWIAYAKLFGNDKDVSKLTTVELSFRFKDILLDSISDAVFLKSLSRVEEVMVHLNYSSLSKSIIDRHQSQIIEEFNKSIKEKEFAGALSRIPFMENISKNIGEDIGQVLKEVMETEVMGEIIKEFTQAILSQMAQKVKSLEVERIVGED
ncbi:hypothetical protein [Leptospira sp. GIMC2001]|uniref:hypothetical protein n=1 Tax=Leptospira sp. GIMC2001 TaxID=1513297 RepID=UPI00234926AA|nr:hypothetical protein [Leptospira sp. GIMC2001]WCL48630.1 hypothetical protein O4O04_15145 [Leptospira sp. GIMC2001]